MPYGTFMFPRCWSFRLSARHGNCQVHKQRVAWSVETVGSALAGEGRSRRVREEPRVASFFPETHYPSKKGRLDSPVLQAKASTRHHSSPYRGPAR
jgi:hypothetical protein